MLRLLQRDLDSDETTIVICAQPWASEPATDPKVTLIGEVLTAV